MTLTRCKKLSVFSVLSLKIRRNEALCSCRMTDHLTVRYAWESFTLVICSVANVTGAVYIRNSASLCYVGIVRSQFADGGDGP